MKGEKADNSSGFCMKTLGNLKEKIIKYII